MIRSFSMCPVCYKRIPAAISVVDGQAVMSKVCAVHKKFGALIDPDGGMFLRNYNTGTMGINKAVLVPVTGTCNMSCGSPSWCYTKGVPIPENSAKYYDRHLHDLKQAGFAILLSGGEPTCRKDFVEFSNELKALGWPVVTMSNMIAFADGNFMKTCGYIHGGTLWADFSMQHPKNYSSEILSAKMQALSNLENLGIKANCIQFSVSDLDELPWIREFYNDTKRLYKNIRIRTLHGFWKDKSEKIYLSQLYKAFLDNFADLMPSQDFRLESTNIYSIYMRTDHCGISLSSSPTVHNVDLASCSRPTYGIALDGKFYGFPVAQIISEGIEKGWYNGYKIQSE